MQSKSSEIDFRIESLGQASLDNPLNIAEWRHFIGDQDRILYRPHLSGIKNVNPELWWEQSFEIAGPREKIHFEPALSRAGIVTCGGLCPGLNAVIRALVLQLWHRYELRSIYGFRYGYHGLARQPSHPPMELSPENVVNIHQQGGTLLGTSRGTPPTSELVDSLQRHGINMLFTIGGDGTMRGAHALCLEIKRRGLPIVVIGIPKTIDNDIPFVRRSFGFESAVGAACQVVLGAHEEARGARNGVGLVKLMGRQSGYIAANTTLATGHVNICLIPEVDFDLHGKSGLLAQLEQRLKQSGHAVIAVAEGAGQKFFEDQPTKYDKSGNAKLNDIGLYLKEVITEEMSRRFDDFTLKYIDPSYIIRAAPANPADILFCSRLAQNAVHAAMAGKTALLIGYWHGEQTHVPLRALEGQRQSINPHGELWFNVLESTGQSHDMLKR